MSGNEVRSAQRVVETLSAYGLQYIFGVPGAKIDPVFDALADGGPELVVCRHEQNAAFMAAAVGRLTGTPGVALVTSGPGTTNLATGLITATTEQDPMVAVCGAVARGGIVGAAGAPPGCTGSGTGAPGGGGLSSM